MIEKRGAKNKKALDVGRVSCFAWSSYLFKYMNFLQEIWSALIGFPKEATKIILPIGISFYTFQLLSYVVDVYRKEVAAQPAYWKLLLYCSLFHQCIAGPVCTLSDSCGRN